MTFLTSALFMVGGILLRWGTEEQKAHFLPKILSGELTLQIDNN